MGYSPIKSIHIKNFRNIGDAVLSFEESPIISLIGENEAGKTSVVKAFSVCALHSTPRDQKDYIRDGTNGFGVEIELEDGTKVTRVKTKTINHYSVKKPDGNIWETAKIDNGIPVEVQNVMGLIEEPETKEYLQVRTYEDQLLFVVTPASTNYKVMYGALKVDQITKAIKAGNKEVNQLKTEIDSNETGINTLNANLRKLRTYDLGPLLKIKDRLEKEITIVDRLERMSKLRDKIDGQKNRAGQLSALANIEPINERIAGMIYRCLEILSRDDTNIYKDIDKAEIVNERVVGLVKRCIEISNRGSINIYKDAEKAEEISNSLVTRLTSISGVIERIETSKVIFNIADVSGAELIEQKDFNIVMAAMNISKRVEALSQLQNNKAIINDYCSRVENYLKSIGAKIVTCNKCGEDIVVDIGGE